jgi:S-adenosylmethionine hydrolase
MKRFVCLLTDFGVSDEYAASMKGALLRISPGVNIIDVTHELPAHDIISAAYILYSIWDYFPRGTVFVCVVDPGVGGERREIVACGEGKYIVCPDNGTLSLLLRRGARLTCFSIKRKAVENTTGKRISATFHGRDIFAPAAGLICNKKFAAIRQQEINPYIIPQVFTETTASPHAIKGRILHIDRFGNCISSIHQSESAKNSFSGKVTVAARNLTISPISKTFADVAPGRRLAYWGSTGFLEIGIRNGNAAAALGIVQLDEVVLR